MIPQEAHRSKPPRPWVVATIVFIVAFDLAFAWQHAFAAQRSEFGAHPDEAGHYVTGLMIRDYLVHGIPGPPMKFADDYYRHYPKIGLGVWPPVFYLVQSAWTIPFGVSRTAILLLMCVLAAAVASLLFRALREEFGILPAAVGATCFLSLPLVREFYSMVMAETLCAVLMFGATLSFGRFLDREKRSDALGFGALAALAILTKGTGVALALVVPIGIVFTRKWRLALRPALWGAGALTAVIAGPWTWHFRNEGRLKGGWLQPNPTFDFTSEAMRYYSAKMYLGLTAVVFVFFLVGLVTAFIRPVERLGKWSAAAALIVSVFVFQCIMPVGLEARHLIPALPAAIMFAIAGAMTIGRFRARRVDESPGTLTPRAVACLALIAVGVAVSTITFVPSQKGWSGFRPLVDIILADHSSDAGTVLVSSDGSGEGMFISEIAMREQRPGHVIERASKVLADMEWSGRNYHAKFSDDQELTDFIVEGKAGYVVLDDSIPEEKHGAHHDMLKRVLRDDSVHFWEVATSPITRGNLPQEAPIRLYRVKRKT